MLLLAKTNTASVLSVHGWLGAPPAYVASPTENCSVGLATDAGGVPASPELTKHPSWVGIQSSVNDLSPFAKRLPTDLHHTAAAVVDVDTVPWV